MTEISVTLSIEQIKNLCAFAGLKITEDNEVSEETEITIIKVEKSIVAYYTEYEDEGGFEL